MFNYIPAPSPSPSPFKSNKLSEIRISHQEFGDELISELDGLLAWRVSSHFSH